MVPEEDSSQYIPGACNIGKEEIRRRYRIGFTGLVFALLMVFIIHATNADRLWRLGVLIPVFYSASGFIQAMNKFCYVYGFRHVFSVQGKRNFTTVSDEERIKKDREKSLQIVLFVTISSMSITAAYYFFN